MMFRVIIPAGGRSSRSGLDYPKTLYKLDGLPILIRICRLVKEYDPKPIVVINPASEDHFRRILAEYDTQAELVFQEAPTGMGNAVLQAEKNINDGTNIILVWSDIPLLSKLTLDNLVQCHQVCDNDLSLVTSLGPNCYTIVEREGGRLMRVKETRALGIPAADYGERDIGLFIFRKRPVFDLLKEDALEFDYGSGGEHGFLYLIEKLAASRKKIEGYPIAVETDILSFNTPEELQAIESVVRRASS